jgi:hypothetical protein
MYDEGAGKLKAELMAKYEEISGEDFFKGNELKTRYGPCYNIKSHKKLKLNQINRNKAKKEILSDLKLISGVGETREKNLQEEGYQTIQDLTEHPRFCDEASKLLKILDSPDCSGISDWISRWYPKSHPLMLCSSGFRNIENFLFMDIETLGLKEVPLILIGVGELGDGDLEVNQYLLRNLHEENAALEAFLAHLNDESVYVTFNGQTFDVPYIKDRMIYYGIKKNIRKPHLDLMHFSRRAWGDRLPNCRLQTLETRLFGMERESDVPSSQVPDFYKTYMKTGNIGPLIPIVEHNREDVVTLARLLSKLQEVFGFD